MRPGPKKTGPYKQPAAKIQTTTLWEFPSQHYGVEGQGDPNYIGVTPSYVIWNLLQRYTKPGERVLDPMCGSGTTLDVCLDLKRQGIGFDLAPSRADIRQADARHLPMEAESVDFAFVDPPYSTHIRYSGDPQCIGEQDAREGGYYEAMEEVIAEIYRVLKPGAYFGLYVSDSQAKGKSFCPLGFELFLRMSKLFDPVDIVCVARQHKSLKRNHWHTSAIEGNYFLRGFNYLFIVRKRPEDSSGRFKHDQAGALSPLFEAASKAKPGEVITPEKFSDLLEHHAEDLEAKLSRKQQKKLRQAETKDRDEPRPSTKPKSAVHTNKKPYRPSKGAKPHGPKRPQR
ncbi:MAG: TRM11 family SAM-dependent methyltransferase [Oligoflexus sp.]|jgi:DNA modification methylase